MLHEKHFKTITMERFILNRKKQLTAILILFLLGFMSNGCRERWSEEKKQNFRQECHASNTFLGLGIIIYDYSERELSNISIQEVDVLRHDTINLNIDDKSWEEGVYRLIISKEINKKKSFIINIGNNEKHILRNFTTDIKATSSMFSENYSCVLNSYELDGIQVQEHAIVIKKSSAYK